MRNFTLATDSCCDINKSELREKGVFCAEMSYIINGVAQKDNFDGEKQYHGYIGLLRTGVMPTTTQLNTFELETFFTDVLKRTDNDLLFITLSSGISGTYNNAVTVAKELMAGPFKGRNIYIADSKGGAAGQRALVDIAVKMRDKGESARSVFNCLNRLIPYQQIYVLVDDLKHLKRGGRISALSAIVGTILNLKPMLVVNHLGQIRMYNKARGIKKVMALTAGVVRENYRGAEEFNGDLDEIIFYIAEADAADNVKALCDAITEKIPDAKFNINPVGPLIGTHVGPGAVGLFFFGKPRLTTT